MYHHGKTLLSFLRTMFQKLNFTKAGTQDYVHHMAYTFVVAFLYKVKVLSVCTQRCYGRHNITIQKLLTIFSVSI